MLWMEAPGALHLRSSTFSFLNLTGTPWPAYHAMDGGRLNLFLFPSRLFHTAKRSPIDGTTPLFKTRCQTNVERYRRSIGSSFKRQNSSTGPGVATKDFRGEKPTHRRQPQKGEGIEELSYFRKVRGASFAERDLISCWYHRYVLEHAA